MLTENRTSSMLDEVEIRFGLTCAAVIVTLLLAGLARLDHTQTLFALLLVTAAGAVALNGRFAVFLGLVAWAFFTGFVTNAYGQLSFAHHDLVLMATLIATAALVSRPYSRAVLQIVTTGGHT